MHVYMLNPLSVVLQQFRYAMVNNATPRPSLFLGRTTRIARAARDHVAIFVLGFVVFNRTAPYVAENL